MKNYRGCKICGRELKTKTQKLLRTCQACAADLRGSFQKAANGNAEGWKEISQKMFGTTPNGELMKQKINKALLKKEKKIIKKLQKKGLSPEEIEQGLQKIRSEFK